MLVEITPSTQYQIKLKSGERLGPYASSRLAEMAIYNLPEDQRILAEVIPMDGTSGKDILFG